MSEPFDSLLDDDPRSKNRVEAMPVTLVGGYVMGVWRGGIGDYFDIIFPLGYRYRGEAISHYVRGACECISAADGFKWIQNKDWPVGNRAALVGDEESLRRPAGRLRFFFTQDDCVRLCVVAIDDAGVTTAEALAHDYATGPRSVVIKKGGVFVLCGGATELKRVPTVEFDEIPIVRLPHVVSAGSADVELLLPDGAFGVSIWKDSGLMLPTRLE